MWAGDDYRSYKYKALNGAWVIDMSELLKTLGIKDEVSFDSRDAFLNTTSMEQILSRTEASFHPAEASQKSGIVEDTNIKPTNKTLLETSIITDQHSKIVAPAAPVDVGEEMSSEDHGGSEVSTIPERNKASISNDLEFVPGPGSSYSLGAPPIQPGCLTFRRLQAQLQH